MTRSLSLVNPRRIAAASLLALSFGLAACGGDDGDDVAPAGETPAAQTDAATVELDKISDTDATAKSASDKPLPEADLQAQIEAVEQGLADAGFSATNVGEVGDAKADFVIDTSWAVYVYDSDRAAAEFVVSIQSIRSEADKANYELFRIGNRVYYLSMTSAVSDEDRAKLDKIAQAAEGAITAG